MRRPFLKLFVDGSWFLAVFMPLFTAGPMWVRIVLAAAFFGWGLFLFQNWTSRAMWDNGTDVFFFEAKVLVALSVFEVVFLGAGSWQEQCGPFAALFMLSGVLFLRSSRLAESGPGTGGFLGRSGRDLLLVVLGAMVLASRTVRTALFCGLGVFYRGVILPILTAAIWLLVQLLAWFFRLISPILPVKFNEVEFVTVTTDMPELGKEAGQAETLGYGRYLAIFLAVVCILGFLYFVFKRISSRGGQSGRNGYGETERGKTEVLRGSQTGLRLLGGEKNVRYYYRKFLMLCAKKGMDLERPLTSAEVEQLAGQHWEKPELSELRALYLKARYDGQEGADARDRARELYRGFKKEVDESKRKSRT